MTDHIHGRALKHYYVRSGRMSTSAVNLINWNAIEKASKKQPSNDNIWLTKFVSKFTATGKNMMRWNKWNHSKCPRCGKDNEDTHHIIMCQDEEARENLYENIMMIDEWMDKYNTHPAIQKMLINTLCDFGRSTFTATANFILFQDHSDLANCI